MIGVFYTVVANRRQPIKIITSGHDFFFQLDAAFLGDPLRNRRQVVRMIAMISKKPTTKSLHTSATNIFISSQEQLVATALAQTENTVCLTHAAPSGETNPAKAVRT